MGKKLIEHTLPEIAYQLERIADALESKQQPDQLKSAFTSFVNNGADDSEIVNQLKQLW
jgi:hypothetical protein